MKNDSDSHRSASRKLDEFTTIKPPPPRGKRAYSLAAESVLLSVTSRPVAILAGFGAGLTLLALALYAFSVATRWANVARDGAQVGYAIVGIFLTVAGIGALAATWNHNFRLPKQQASGHH